MKRNSTNTDITINADGFDISGGTTARKLTISGGNISVVGSGVNTYTFPATTATLQATTADVQTNHITETTGTHGVDIDGLTIKDGSIINGYMARAYSAAGDQTLNDNSATKITLGTESYDTAEHFTASAYIIPVNGYYQINAMVSVYDAGEKIIKSTGFVYFGGAAIITNVQRPSADNTAESFVHSMSDIKYLVADSAVELYVQVDVSDAAGTSVVRGGSDKTFLSVYLVSL
jgi:hypothetical protein